MFESLQTQPLGTIIAENGEELDVERAYTVHNGQCQCWKDCDCWRDKGQVSEKGRLYRATVLRDALRANGKPYKWCGTPDIALAQLRDATRAEL